MIEKITVSRRQFLGALAMTIAATEFNSLMSAAMRSELSALADATTWVPSPRLTMSDLQGKVILVDFWTYSCINWRRQLPYVRAWAEKYREKGLLVVGVHAPEFSFEKNIENVRWAVQDMKIPYPVVLDNEQGIWRAFDNEAWPALYFIDSKGRVRHHYFGEGQYEQSEKIIQQLLRDTGREDISNDLVSIIPEGAEAPADWKSLLSGENYVGYARTENFAARGGIKADKPHVYEPAAKLRLNEWAPSGDWTIGKEAILLNQPNGRLAYRFHARDLHLVMAPSAANKVARFRVFIDGEVPRDAHGVDVDAQGTGVVEKPRMYQLIRQHFPITDRLFEIEFLDAGIEAFSFTFG